MRWLGIPHILLQDQRSFSEVGDYWGGWERGGKIIHIYISYVPFLLFFFDRPTLTRRRSVLTPTHAQVLVLKYGLGGCSGWEEGLRSAEVR